MLDAKDMTLRDYFAAKAMQSLLLIGTSTPTIEKDDRGIETENINVPYYFGEEADNLEGPLGFDAYRIADAMLVAREGCPDQQ